MARLDAAIDAIALRAEVAAGRAQVTSSETLVAELRADAETQQSNESASNRALMEQCVKKDASIAALQIKIGDQAADIEKLRLDLASATEALSSSRRRIEGKEKTIREGASLIGELNAEKLHASNDKAKLEAELAASADVIAKLRRDLEIANEKEMEDKLAYESMRDRAKRDNERAAQQSAASRDALDSALGDLEEARQEAAQAQQCGRARSLVKLHELWGAAAPQLGCARWWCFAAAAGHAALCAGPAYQRLSREAGGALAQRE